MLNSGITQNRCNVGIGIVSKCCTKQHQMKIVLTFFCAFLLYLTCSAQIENIGDYEVKVFSYKFKTTKGFLKKINAEGIGIEDKKGNYIIFRTADIKKIKVKKRGLTLLNGLTGGTLIGAGLGGAIWSLDESGENTADMAKLTVILAASGAVIGTAAGGFSELANKKLTLRVKGNQQYFKDNFHRLEKYLNHSEPIQHVNN